MAQANVGKRDFAKEFEAMGRDKVRSDLMLGKFPPEKRVAARLWVEQADAESWQATRKDVGPRKSVFRNPKIMKILPYLGGIAMLGFALARLARRF
jgi:hypothetical protein